MARISELHYSNAYAATSGISEFLEVALSPGEDPADFTVTFYQANGSPGLSVGLDDPGVQVSVDADSGETVYVVSADFFNIRLTDPDGGGANNYEAYALTNDDTGDVIDFYDIGGGTQNIVANGGPADGATSVNLPVLVGPNQTTTTLQFNANDPTTLVYDDVDPGDSGVICFAAGTGIATPRGRVEVENLRVGDAVLTADGRAVTLRWVGAQNVSAMGAAAPIEFAPGALGAKRALRLSPQHRILLHGGRVEVHSGQARGFLPAKALVGQPGIRRCPQSRVTYYHLLCDAHEVILAEGVPCETLLLAPQSLAVLTPRARAEIALLGLRPQTLAYPVLDIRAATCLAPA